MKSINNLVLILIKFMFLCNFTILRKLIVETTLISLCYLLKFFLIYNNHARKVFYIYVFDIALTLKGPGIFTVFHVGADLKLQIGM